MIDDVEIVACHPMTMEIRLAECVCGGRRIEVNDLQFSIPDGVY